MLSSQVNSLRLMARLVRDYDYKEISRMLREAADTIEKLGPHSDQLEPSRWHELFGTPEKAARTIAKWCAENDGSCAGCPLFMYGVGIKHCEQDEDDMPSLLESLRGDA